MPLACDAVFVEEMSSKHRSYAFGVLSAFADKPNSSARKSLDRGHPDPLF
jgi:hypothetical protein